MKLRSVGQLEWFLSRQLQWRKKELTSLKFATLTSSESTRGVVLRAAIGLLYSHWEGFARDASAAYLRHANEQGLPLRAFKPHFQAIAAARYFDGRGGSTLATRRRVFDLLASGSGEPASISWDRYHGARGNLTAKALKRLTDDLGLDFTPFELKAKPVIDRLVEARNNIVHGRGLQVELSEYELLHAEIVLMLDEFKNQIEDAAGTRGYRAA